MYEVILYYNFTPVEDPETFCKKHKKWLKKSGLKGRVYISKEGINGTLGGTPEQIQNYRNYLWGIDGFENSEFKTDEHDAIPFAKLVCKVRDEIVAIYDNYGYETEVLAASIRHPMHVVQAAQLGADVATMPLSVIEQLLKHPLTDIGLDKFLADWDKLQASLKK